MQRLLITNDLHQRQGKWEALVDTAERERPAFILIAGDILPKDRGITRQRDFFPLMRSMLETIRQDVGVRVLLQLGNDDGHFLEPLVDALAEDGLCVNLNQRVHRESGLVFCGMNKVRDYPFGYKHYCVPDGDRVTDPVQFCNPAITFDDKGREVEIPDLKRYLLSKQSIGQNLESLKAQLQPGEMARSVWMVHQPPAGLGMDICSGGREVGSPALTSFIEENQPLLGCSVYGAHSLRHYFVTQATAAGMPGAMIKSITGHGSDGMLEHYQQIGADLAADLAKRIQGTAAATLATTPAMLADATGDPLEALRGRILELAEGITAKTWKTARAELLVLTKAC